MATRKRINPTMPEGIDGNAWDALKADLRGHIWNKVSPYANFGDLAGRAKLHVRTVESFMWGETQSPHFLTVFKLCFAVDLHLRLMALFTHPEPVPVSKARQLKMKSKQTRRQRKKKAK